MFPYIAITMGECSGTGPEMILKLLSERKNEKIIVFASLSAMKRTASDLGINWPFESIVSSYPELEAVMSNDYHPILFDVGPVEFEYGRTDFKTAIMSIECMRKAVEAITNGYASTLIAMPVDENAPVAINCNQDMLRLFSQSDRLVEMVSAPDMNIFEHPEITKESIIEALVTIDSLYVSPFFDCAKPIAVSSVVDVKKEEAIEEAVEIARSIGIEVVGPLPIDVLERDGKRGCFSSIVVFPQNKANSSFSSDSLDDTVVISWGLPFLSVSLSKDVEHDKAGKNVADTRNLSKALSIAKKLSDPNQMA